MFKKNKIIIFIILVFFCLSLTACGGGGGSIINPVPEPEPPVPPVNPGASISGYIAYGETADGAAPQLERTDSAQKAAANQRAAAGELAANAAVELRKKGDYNTILSTVYTVNGRFIFNGLDPAEYIITARALDGGTLLKAEFGVNVINNKYEYEIGSSPIELVKTGDIVLTVKNGGGEPIADASVTIDGLRGERTSSDGVITFNEITRGAHEIKTIKNGFFESLDTITVKGGTQAASIIMQASNGTLSQPEVSGIYFNGQQAIEKVVIEGDTLDVSVSSSNPNDGALTFNWQAEAGEFLSQNEYSVMGPVTTSLTVWRAPLINWTSGQTYAYRGIEVSVSDQKGFIIKRAARLKIINKNVIDFQITSMPAELLLNLNQRFSYQLTVSKPGEYIYEKLDGPSAMNVSANGLIEFTPAAYGEYGTVIRVKSAASQYFQTQKFLITVMDSIAELNGASFSKTALKPGSGLFAIIKNLKSTEHLTLIGYNKNPSYTAFEFTASILGLPVAAPEIAFTPIQSLMQTEILQAAPVENLNTEALAALKMDRARRENERKSARLKKTSEEQAAAYTAKAPEKQIEIGETRNFYSLNSLAWPPRERDWTRVSARLRAAGNHCCIYEDTEMPYPYLPLTDNEINRFKQSFDNEIYPIITGTFGDEPNPGIDNDSRVYILFTHNVNKQTASGYFDSTNQLTQAALDSSAEYNKNSSGYKYYSNEKEIFYMAVPKNSFQGESYQTNALGVIAHEFQHMINWHQHSQKNPDILEETWLNEGLSQLAQDISGYGYQYGTLSFVMEPFLRYPESYSLTKFQFGLGYYGSAYLFVRYLADRGAVPMNLVKNTKIGRACVEDEIKRIGAAASFDDFFAEYAAALYLSNSGVTDDAKYNFKSINIRAAQKDGTKLSGLKLNSTIYIPGTHKSPSLDEYALSAVKCRTQNAADYKLNISDKNASGIGTIILRINGQ